jgi:hypothetical protein
MNAEEKCQKTLRSLQLASYNNKYNYMNSSQETEKCQEREKSTSHTECSVEKHAREITHWHQIIYYGHINSTLNSIMKDEPPF